MFVFSRFSLPPISPLPMMLSAFFCGIGIEKIAGLSPAAVLVILLLAVLCLGLAWLPYPAILRQINFFLVLLFCCLFLGMLRCSFSVCLPAQSAAFLPEDKSIILTGKVCSRPKVSDAGNTSFLLEMQFYKNIQGVDCAGKMGWRTSCGKVKVICQGLVLRLGDGDVILAQGKLATFDDLFNPGGFSLEDYNFEQGIYKTFFVAPLDIQFVKKGRPALLSNLVFNLQQQIRSHIYHFMPGYRDLLGSVLVGSTVAGLDQQTKDKYKKAGLSHLLVASGMQISIIVGSVAALLSSFKLSPKPTFYILSGLNVFCFLLTGAGTSIARACLMFQFVLLAKWLGREGSFLLSLFLAALIITLFSPLALFSPSFLLSFAATVGVTSFAPFLAQNLFVGFPKWLAEMLSASLAPLLLTYPICVYFFHQASTVAFLANLVVLPAISSLTIFSAITLVLSFLAPPLAKVLGLAIYGPLFLMDHFVGFAAGLPGSTINIPRISIFAAALIYLVMFAMIKIAQKFGRKTALFTCGLLLFSFFMLSAFSG
ncbi:MAG: ComEC/Rec2 family competence protein, partial [Candidatus Margulisiibacteriota bacterium]